MIRMYNKERPKKNPKEVSRIRSIKAKNQPRDRKGRFCKRDDKDRSDLFYFVATKPKRRF